MKIKAFVLSLFLVSIAMLHSETLIAQDSKKEIKKEQLPEKVKATFKESDYASWTIVAIFEVKGDSEQPTYEINVKNEVEDLVLTYDKEGKLLSKANKDKEG
ncbi:PepSY-like domain-containing protein [Fulvivirgaceae bacterium BMA10]|uniref:PepSY-like domain-containing protein n=1 Tax=Splendidivirga corallicola TaxID=3051826 RepID=A0ABT8KIR5_9BACT|nr:PepSY-like domain-containing protein [Fulvivirgaceae bacterium BMA10]